MSTTIYMLEIYVKSASSDYESNECCLYYFDKKKKAFEVEQGWLIDGHAYIWPEKQSFRTIPGLIKKYKKDFNRIKSIFNIFEMNVTEIGEL